MPSIMKSIDESSYQYQVQSQKAWRNQSSGSSRPKGISLTGGEFSEFVDHMRSEVNMIDWVFPLRKDLTCNFFQVGDSCPRIHRISAVPVILFRSSSEGYQALNENSGRPWSEEWNL